MSLIVLFDLVAFLTSLMALIILLIGWKRILERDVKLLIAGLLIFSLLYSFCLVLEWSGITSTLDPFEDFIGALIPMWWAFLFYAILQHVASFDLRQSEERFRQLAKGTFEAVVIFDKGEIIEANKQYYDMFGYRPEELAGKDAMRITTTSASQKLVKEQTSLDDPGPCEVSGLKKDGTEFPIEIRMRLFEFRGQKVRMAAIRDLTERKKAEESIANALNELKDFMDAIPDIAYKIGQDLHIANWNRAAEEILGYSSEEISRMNALDFFAKEDHGKIAKAIQEVYDQGQSEIDAHFLTKDEKRIPCLLSGKISKDSEGNITGLAGVAKDMTKALQAEEEKKNLEVQLQQAKKMEAIGALAGGVAHDLNNVLSGIVSYPDLLLKQLPEDSPLIEPIRAIQATGQKAAAIVQDLLTLARRGVLISDVVNLNAIIEEYLASPEYDKLKSFNPGIELETNLDTDLLNILGSPIHLSQSVMNLISNAAEAMPEGGKISISTRNEYVDTPINGYDSIEEGDYAVLMISDTGAGIYSEDLERIFEPFYTKKKMGKSGTGLGMAVVWGTVKDHKGYIEVKSAVGKGTTFTIYFPVTKQKQAKDEIETSAETYRGSGETILIIDDIEEQRNISSSMLSELGYSVTAVSSGEEAVEYLKNDSVDLLLLDMLMEPGMDGLDTYKKILQLHPGQKAIIVSGFSETDRVKEAQRLGAGKCIRKPYTLKEIAITVKNEIDRGRP